jgi:S-DNA-T family DNA segregation ATPase FtsK/SpoIIIE
MGRPKGSKNKTKNTERNRSKVKAQEQAAPFMGEEIAIIVTFAISIFLFLSNLGVCGPVGAFLKAMQLGLFGSLGYLFPLVLSFLVTFEVSNQENTYATLKMIAAICIMIFVAAMLQLTFAGGVENRNLGDFFVEAEEQGIGGGIIGGALALILYGIAGKVGAMLILMAAILICFVYITEKPLARMFARGSMHAAERATERAREDFSLMAENARIHHAKRLEERAFKRGEDIPARGVDLDATMLSAKPPETEGDGKRKLDNIPILKTGGEIDLPLNSRHPSAVLSREELSLRNRSFYIKEDADKDADKEAEQAPDQHVIQDAGFASTAPTVEHPAADDKKPKMETDAEIPVEDYTSKAASLEPDYNVFTGQISGLGQKSEEIRSNAGNIPPETPETDPDEIKIELPEPEDEVHDVNVTSDSSEIAGSDVTGTSDDTSHSHPEAGVIKPETYDDNPYDAAESRLSAAEERALRTGSTEPMNTEASAPDKIRLHSGEGESGNRRIITSNGKVIDSDVESIQKKIEARKQEAASEADNAKVQQEILEKKPVKPYVFPPLTLLKRGGEQDMDSREEIQKNAIILQQTLKSFGVGVTVTNVTVGPAVTRYELQPEIGVKVSRITSLSDDIKMRLAAADIRIEAPIPGKSAVGIEVPNKKSQVVYLGDVLASKEFQSSKAKIAFGVGKDIAGNIVVTDIAKMPHLLIAGATGSGKSVSINTLIMSIIYKYKPEDVRMIMVDPKVVELQVYNGIPHLLIPVVTDPKKAAAALNWCVAEMTDRYKKFAATGSRDLKGYNEKVEQVRKDPEIPDEQKPEKLPQIVIIIDELADLMMVSAQEVEDAICRIAQLARACGMHLVIATQRPSVNVITGLIKANVPSRIAFAVSSGVDSRTIIDMNGAEKLLGKGDMLFFPQGLPKPIRVQGAFVSDEEVQTVVDFLKENTEAEYNDNIKNTLDNPGSGAGGGAQNDRDELFNEAGALIIESEKASIGMLQRKFRIGFNRAARIMDQLAEAQVVGPEEGTKPRKILMTIDEFDQMISG